MSACSPSRMDDLEALVKKDLLPDRADEVAAHASSCPACQAELLWLRTEHDLLIRRAEAAAPLSPALWAGVERRLVPKAAPLPAPLARRRQSMPLGALGWVAAVGGVLAVAGSLGLSHVIGFGKNVKHHSHFSITFDDGPPVVARAAVTGPANFRMETISADVDVVPGRGDQVQVTVSDCDIKQVTLVQRDDHLMTVAFDGQERLRHGKARVELPAQSQVDLRSTSGDLSLSGPRGSFGKSQLSTTSGCVQVKGADEVTAHSTSGDVTIDKVEGEVEADTTSGDIEVTAPDGPGAGRTGLHTTSGELTFRGACKKGCRLDAQAISGEVHLILAESSAFALTYATRTGDLTDHLGMTRRDLHPPQVDATYGDGSGTIRCTTVNGDLEVTHP